MKTALILIAGFAIGTAAIAQDAPTSTVPAGPESQAVPPAPAEVPAADAPPPAPATTALPAEPSTGLPAPTTADMSTYPRCSAGQTDKCVQREGRSRR